MRIFIVCILVCVFVSSAGAQQSALDIMRDGITDDSAKQREESRYAIGFPVTMDARNADQRHSP